MAAKEDPKAKPEAAAPAAAKKPPKEEAAKSVEDIEKEFREYSVAEFFKKNRQMLGYTGKVRSLTTIVHEYASNSLDACEDAKVLPDIIVEIQELPNDHYKVAVEDNGTGIPKSKVGQALGKLLAGTKFHQRAQKRGQQGIGACMRGDTLVPLADGRVLPIREIVEADLKGTEVLALDLETMKLTPAPIKACVRVCNPEFIEVRTLKGERIHLTPENPVLTLENGSPAWIRADRLKPGQRIAAPTHLTAHARAPRTLDLLQKDDLQVDNPLLVRELHERLRARLGGLDKVSMQTGIPKDALRNWFTRRMPNGNPRGRPRLTQLLELARHAGLEADALREQVGRVGRRHTFVNIPVRVTPDVCWLAGLVAGDGHLTSERDDHWGAAIYFANVDKALIDRFCEKMREVFGLRYGVIYNAKKGYYHAYTSSTIVGELFESLGLTRGRKFDTFELSPALFACEDACLAAYLRGLFDAEGSVTPRIRAVTLQLRNPRALEQVRLALLRLGIQSSLQKAGSDLRVMVCGKRNLETFLEKVGFSSAEKNQLIHRMASTIRTRYEPTRVIPETGRLLCALVREQELRRSELPTAARAALRRQSASLLAVEQVLQLAQRETPAQERLSRLAQADVFWLTVRSVRRVPNSDPEHRVYDLEVDGHHNFVAGGLVVHNSYATLFSQLTTGKESHVKTSIGEGKVYECDISVDVQKNEPVIKNEKEYAGKFRGTRIEAEFSEVTYNRSEYSVYEYLRRTALANPHAQLTLIEPTREIIVFPRAAKEIPKKPGNVLPHPLGIHTSDLIDMAKTSEARKISSFLVNDFTRVSSDKAKELEEVVAKDGKGDPVDFDRAPKTLTWPEAERIAHAIGQVKWIAPETTSLIPIGDKTIEKSLKALLQPEQLAVSSRKPKVFRGGIPFLVEAAIAYGGKAGTAKEGGVKGSELLRFANRVPLLFDAGTCATTEAVKTIDWGRYDLKPLEEKPVSVFINFVSVYVPYTGAGKLAIAQEDEIVQEIRQALMECARDVSVYLHGLAKAEEQERRRTLFFRYIDEVARSLEALTGKDRAVLMQKLQKMAKERTEIALRGEEEEVDKELEKLEKAEKQLEEEV